MTQRTHNQIKQRFSLLCTSVLMLTMPIVGAFGGGQESAVWLISDWHALHRQQVMMYCVFLHFSVITSLEFSAVWAIVALLWNRPYRIVFPQWDLDALCSFFDLFWLVLTHAHWRHSTSHFGDAFSLRCLEILEMLWHSHHYLVLVKVAHIPMLTYFSCFQHKELMHLLKCATL